MIEVVKYSKANKEQWDEFVANANIQSFLFFRDYMEYHKDRFEDYSLMIFEKRTLKLILPANVVDNKLYSHQGLTFGGFFTNKQISYQKWINYLNAINIFLKNYGISEVSIKLPPFFYSSSLAQSILPIMHLNQTKTDRCEAGSFIRTKDFHFPRKCVKSGKLELFKEEYSHDFQSFWNLLEINLMERHNTKPVHTIDEIQLLAQLFPQNIKLYLLKDITNNEIMGGSVLFSSKGILKVQYFATSHIGRKNRVSDVLYYNIIRNHLDTKDFIDFGSSMNIKTKKVCKNLLSAKEKFGASTFPIYTFSYSTSIHFDF